MGLTDDRKRFLVGTIRAATHFPPLPRPRLQKDSSQENVCLLYTRYMIIVQCNDTHSIRTTFFQTFHWLSASIYKVDVHLLSPCRPSYSPRSQQPLKEMR